MKERIVLRKFTNAYSYPSSGAIDATQSGGYAISLNQPCTFKINYLGQSKIATTKIYNSGSPVHTGTAILIPGQNFNMDMFATFDNRQDFDIPSDG
jgi:hypothetical protein